jgi:hypothetical protein
MRRHLINKGFKTSADSYKYFHKFRNGHKLLIKTHCNSYQKDHFEAKIPLVKPFLIFFNKSLNPTAAPLEQFLVIFIAKQVWYK